MIPTIDRRSSANANKADITTITHDLHPTGLEQFMKCPYQYHLNDQLPPTPLTGREAFYEGDITEQLMTAYQYGEKLGDEVLRNFGNSTEFPFYERLKKHAQNWKDFLTSTDTPQSIKDRFPLFTQKRMTIRILMDGHDQLTLQPITHEIYLTGTADWIYSDYTMADCKTAKSKWGNNEPDFRLQWRLYPWMRRQVSNLPQLKRTDTFDFTYFVFTKQVTPQLQIINLTYSYEDSERLIFHLLNEFIQAYDTDNREPKKCLGCKWCSLRNMCPRYGEDSLSSFATPEPASDSNNNSEERRF